MAMSTTRLIISGIAIGLVLVALVGIGTLISVSNWRAAVRSTNEAAAVKTLRTISEQQMLYFNSQNRRQFGTFDQMVTEGLLDSRFSGNRAIVNGYVFTIKVIPKSANQQSSYTINADPQESKGSGATGRNHFYLDSTDAGTIHVNETQPATLADPPLRMSRQKM